MKTTINCYDALLTINDEELDNDNFIDLEIQCLKTDGEKGDYYELTVCRNELMSALIGFDAKVSRLKDNVE